MATMNQCKTCLHRECKDKLVGCAVADLFHAFRELLKQLPLFEKHVQPFECGNYTADNRLTGFPDTMHPMCRCKIKYDDHFCD